jgi:deoxyribose-phosphate aldolase
VAQAPALPAGFELPLKQRLPRIGSIDQVAVEMRAGELAKRSIKRESKVWALELAIRCCDLTTLEGQDTPGKVAALCSKAVRPDPTDPGIPSVAAVCVYPNLVPVAVERLAGTTVKVASVATAFPSGQSPLDVKIREVEDAVGFGADEVDMVIDRGAFLSGRYAQVYDEICRVKEACGEAHLKVILEVAELGTYDAARAPGDARGDPRRLRGDRAARRDEAGRRHPHVEERRAVPRAGSRDARTRVVDAGSVPHRRVVPRERHPDADPQGEDGRLPVEGLLHE